MLDPKKKQQMSVKRIELVAYLVQASKVNGSIYSLDGNWMFVDTEADCAIVILECHVTQMLQLTNVELCPCHGKDQL